MDVRNLRADPRFAPFVVALASVMVLGTALLSQYAGGLEPCVLCIYQRYPYGIAIALSLTAFALAGRPEGVALSKMLVYGCGVLFLAGMGIAAFHVGVEQHWWEGTAGCGATRAPETIEELRAMLEAQPVVRCDEVAWSLFGISMAGYNVLVSALLAAFCAVAPGRVQTRASS